MSCREDEPDGANARRLVRQESDGVLTHGHGAVAGAGMMARMAEPLDPQVDQRKVRIGLAMISSWSCSSPSCSSSSSTTPSGGR